MDVATKRPMHTTARELVLGWSNGIRLPCCEVPSRPNIGNHVGPAGVDLFARTSQQDGQRDRISICPAFAFFRSAWRDGTSCAMGPFSPSMYFAFPSLPGRSLCYFTQSELPDLQEVGRGMEQPRQLVLHTKADEYPAFSLTASFSTTLTFHSVTENIYSTRIRNIRRLQYVSGFLQGAVARAQCRNRQG